MKSLIAFKSFDNNDYVFEYNIHYQQICSWGD